MSRVGCASPISAPQYVTTTPIQMLALGVLESPGCRLLEKTFAEPHARPRALAGGPAKSENAGSSLGAGSSWGPAFLRLGPSGPRDPVHVSRGVGLCSGAANEFALSVRICRVARCFADHRAGHASREDEAAPDKTEDL